MQKKRSLPSIFQVEFVETRIKEFVDTLHQKCAEQGLLRRLNTGKEEAASVLVEDRKQRVEEIKKRLVEMNKLRNEWEEKQLFSNDPTEVMRCEKEISKLKSDIEKLKEELKSLAS
ncbi:MAG: hypothetical protein ICV52_18585 [Microcoleus sp. C1-bin4]|nr:hypothetical protein [Microcoleus sp. C1-bin4]